MAMYLDTYDQQAPKLKDVARAISYMRGDDLVALARAIELKRSMQVNAAMLASAAKAILDTKP